MAPRPSNTTSSPYTNHQREPTDSQTSPSASHPLSFCPYSPHASRSSPFPFKTAPDRQVNQPLTRRQSLTQRIEQKLKRGTKKFKQSTTKTADDARRKTTKACEATHRKLSDFSDDAATALADFYTETSNAWDASDKDPDGFTVTAREKGEVVGSISREILSATGKGARTVSGKSVNFSMIRLRALASAWECYCEGVETAGEPWWERWVVETDTDGLSLFLSVIRFWVRFGVHA